MAELTQNNNRYQQHNKTELQHVQHELILRVVVRFGSMQMALGQIFKTSGKIYHLLRESGEL